MRIYHLAATVLVLALFADASRADSKKPPGYWCFTTEMDGAHNSTCTRKREDCERGVAGMRQLGGTTVSECAWQEDAWKTKLGGETYLLATKEDCEQMMGQTKCKRVK